MTYNHCSLWPYQIFFTSISTLTVGFISTPFYMLYKQVFARISNMNE